MFRPIKRARGTRVNVNAMDLPRHIVNQWLQAGCALRPCTTAAGMNFIAPGPEARDACYGAGANAPSTAQSRDAMMLHKGTQKSSTLTATLVFNHCQTPDSDSVVYESSHPTIPSPFGRGRQIHANGANMNAITENPSDRKSPRTRMQTLPVAAQATQIPSLRK